MLLPLVHNISLTLIEFVSVRNPNSIILTLAPPKITGLLSQAKKLPQLKCMHANVLPRYFDPDSSSNLLKRSSFVFSVILLSISVLKEGSWCKFVL